MTKKRVGFYSACLVLISIYILLYIDFNRFHNFTKIKYSYYPSYTISGFNKVRRKIDGDNMLNAKIVFIIDEPYLRLKNFEDVLINNSNKDILKADNLHPTQRLALFSMGYLYNYFIEHLRNNELNEKIVKRISDCYLFVHQEIMNPISTNFFTINDHAISERVQFIALFSSYLKEYYPEKKELLKALLRDYNLCVNLLCDNNFFTWQTNHGIMQLRSLGQLVAITHNREARLRLKKEFDRRLNDIMPYFIGDDGAIYESATEYWYYIYNQFLKISNISDVEDLESVKRLKSKLKKSRYFLNMVASCEGYIHGIGDSYSYYLKDLDVLSVPQNRFFDFSNNIVGGNWCYKKKKVNFLFSSLHTPPNVHKQTDDLMISLYINGPFFCNTGTYSYDYSEERLFFKNNENAHTTTSIRNQNIQKADSSYVVLNSYDSINSKVVFKGEKYYRNSKKVVREITTFPHEGEFLILDASPGNDELISSFNIAPGTITKRISNNEFSLINKDSIEIFLKSNHEIKSLKTIISTEKEKLDTINRLEIVGKIIETTISFEPPNEGLDTFDYFKSNFSNEMRYSSSFLLRSKYSKRPKVGLKTKLLYQFSYIFIILILCAWFFEKRLLNVF